MSNNQTKAETDYSKAVKDRDRALRAFLDAPPTASIANYAHAFREAYRWAEVCRVRVEAEKEVSTR